MNMLSLRFRTFLAPIIGGLAIMTMLLLLAARIEPLVDAAWFGLRRDVYFGPEATLWVSLALASVISYLFLLAFGATVEARKNHPATKWARSYLIFLVLLYSLVAAQCVMLVEATGDSDPFLWRSSLESELTFLIVHILLVASLAAILWVLAFNLSDYGRSARQIFISGSVVLAGSRILLDPGGLDLLGSVFGLWDPQHGVSLDSFPKTFAYLAPLTPLVWSAWQPFPSGDRAAKWPKYAWPAAFVFLGLLTLAELFPLLGGRGVRPRFEWSSQYATVHFFLLPVAAAAHILWNLGALAFVRGRQFRNRLLQAASALVSAAYLGLLFVWSGFPLWAGELWPNYAGYPPWQK